MAAGTASPQVNAGDKIMWRASGLVPAQNYGIGTFSATGNFKVYGNAYSLYNPDKDNWGVGDDMKIIGSSKDYALYKLFADNTYLVDAEKMYLPLTQNVNYPFAAMFSGCTNLVTGPDLAGLLEITSFRPWTNTYYFANMFEGCTSLTRTPKISLEDTGDHCCYKMFAGCTSLTTAPELDTTDLGGYCYANMFERCTSLTTAPSILPSTTLSGYCYDNMFYGCTSLTTAPELPAATLKNYCYRNMFYGCTNLAQIKCLATDISATSCTSNWVSNVASSGTFIKASSMSSWTTGVSGIPTNWSVQDA